MRSSFGKTQRKIMATSEPKIDETYDLRGLNFIAPDQIMPKGESPWTINSRMYARDDNDTRVANRTRKGSDPLSTAVDETLDAQNVDTGTGDVEFTTTRIIAQPFSPTTDGALTRLDFEIKRAAGATGHVMIQVCEDNGGVPGQIIGETSILSSDITDTYQYVPSYLMDAPDLNNGSDYFALLFIQDNGSGSYYVRQTADAGALDLDSVDGGVSWNSLGSSFRFKSYLSMAEGVKGYIRRYPSDGQKRTLFAADDSVYSAQDNGTVSVLDATLNPGSSYVRFAFVDDKNIWVNGINAPRWYDGSAVSNIPNAPLAATHVIIHQGRAFFVTDKTLVRFSELYDFATYPSVNFFYVPDPKNSDPIVGWRSFQDNLVIWTHETKHIVFGNDISSFTRKEAIGTKGAVSDEAIAVDKNNAYFMADDGSVNAFNGISDKDISGKMEPEFSAIVDKSKVRFHLYRNQLRVYYAKAPSAYNNRMALYDIATDQWFLDTDKNIVGSLEWTQDNNELIEFSSVAAWMFKGEQGYSDAGKPIDWKYWTNYKIYGSGASKKRIKRFRPVIRTVDANYTMLVGKDMDFANRPDMREYIVSGGGAKWGAFVWGDGTKYGRNKMIDKQSAMSGRGRHIQYRFERRGVETPVELYGYIAQIKEGRPK
jgi:hypothetical protein